MQKPEGHGQRLGQSIYTPRSHAEAASSQATTIVKELKDRQLKGEPNFMISGDKIVKRKLKPDAGATIPKTI